MGNYYYNQETSKFEKSGFCLQSDQDHWVLTAMFVKAFLAVLIILSFSLTHSDHFVTVLLAVWAWSLLNRQN